MSPLPFCPLTGPRHGVTHTSASHNPTVRVNAHTYTRPWTGLAAIVGWVALLSTATASAGSPPDCGLPVGILEHALCESPELMAAAAQVDDDLARVLDRQPDPDGLRRQQVEWQAETIAHCGGSACLLQAHRDRSRDLRMLLTRALDLRGQAWAPLLSRRIERIDDTAVVHGLHLRSGEPVHLHWELHPDPADDREWAGAGPAIQVFCHPPDRREGYASRFQFRTRAWGVEFTPVVREHGRAYLLAGMTLGEDLPLDEDIVCAVAFTEWLLDHPSHLYLVPAHRNGGGGS